MSKPERDQAFFDMADRFIALANSMAEETDAGRVSASLLFAAARFNTFLVARSASNGEELSGFQGKATAYYEAEYSKMLLEHFADYVEHFDTYLGKPPGGHTLN